ncbi:hypothetical protein [Chryseobacterium aureum]|uniref:hypothetical protein n=1 Tax=Chryseobacterium aureum TaxID=2497456 RepID=UPI000F8650A8|nr:hypothetical protein [Chryseobacterium aureum]
MEKFDQLDKLLSKYSYPIFTLSGNTQHSATAFFYLDNEITYLVSNYHSIKGMSPMHNRQFWKSDILYLKIINPETNKFQIVNVDIREEITGQTEIFYMDNRIDLFKIKIDIQNLNVNFINDLVNPLYINSIPKRVLVYGYPNPDGIQDTFWSRISKFDSQYNIDGFDNFYFGTLRNMPRFNEKDRMYALNRFYFFINGMIAGGYSGAPIIGEFENEQNEKVYYFIGVNFGNEPFSNQTWAIRGDKALEYILN